MSRIWIYQAAVFLSAFLFFQIQPMTSKALLPLFGGSYLVWGICMVFYQAVLLLGYLYAHAVHRWFGVVRYSKFHWVLLLLPLLAVTRQFIVPDTTAGSIHGVLSIVVTLTMAVGLPVFALSTTSIMLQKWLLSSNLPEKTNPYMLYSGSNLGSMLGLLTYPVLVEPFMSLDLQWHVWLAGYLCVVGLDVFCMPAMNCQEKLVTAEKGQPLPAGVILRWLMLSAAGSAILLAITNVMTLDLASIPFLWILPLAVYLFAYVLTFKARAWYPAWWPRVMNWAIMLGVLLYLMIQIRLTLPVAVSIGLYMLILFVICLICSGELVRSKPQDTDRNMTVFYLVLATGGLAGSLFVGWVIPLVSKSLVELPLALVLAAVSVALCSRTSGGSRLFDAHALRRAALPVLICGFIAVLASTLVPAMLLRHGSAEGKEPLLMMVIAVPVVLLMLWNAGRPWQFAAMTIIASISLGFTEDIISKGGRISRFRNFYGIYKVYDAENLRYLQHGTTQHGRQYVSGSKVGVPLSYYHPSGPVGMMLVSTNFSFRRIGMIGLGTGAMAAYIGEHQSFTIFELDPDNLPIAEKNFTYLNIARAHGAEVKFVVGDGRLSIRGLKDGSLDLLMVDAFNSGSIPVHLLTLEAIGEYFRVLGGDGLLLVHVSNRFIDLAPVVCSNAGALGLKFCEKSNAGEVHPDAEMTQWVALSRNPVAIETLVKHLGWSSDRVGTANLPEPWTDRYSNVLGSLVSISSSLQRSMY